MGPLEVPLGLVEGRGGQIDQLPDQGRGGPRVELRRRVDRTPGPPGGELSPDVDQALGVAHTSEVGRAPPRLRNRGRTVLSWVCVTVVSAVRFTVTSQRRIQLS